MIRALLALFVVSLTLVGDGEAQAQPSTRPYRIYAITFRGMTDVEKGFQDYFAARRIPVQITWRDLNRENSRMPGFLEEIKRTKPDLVYTWGTSVTLGVVGTYDQVDPAVNIGQNTSAKPTFSDFANAMSIFRSVPRLRFNSSTVKLRSFCHGGTFPTQPAEPKIT
jgi:hypothetical protein